MSVEISMNVEKGDKVVAKKQLKVLGTVAADVNDVFEVKGVYYNSICVVTDDVKLTVDNKTFYEHFEKFEEEESIEENIEEKYSILSEVIPNSVTYEMIDDIINESDIVVSTVFDKCTVVSCKLPNGFIITESSACVDSENYDEEIGIKICMDKIIDKVWELEGYLLQNDLYTIKNIKEDLGLN